MKPSSQTHIYEVSEKQLSRKKWIANTFKVILGFKWVGGIREVFKASANDLNVIH